MVTSVEIHPSEIQAMCVVARLVVEGSVGAGVSDVEAVMARGRNNVQRWLQRMARLGLLVIVGSAGVQRLYRPTQAWASTAARLAEKRRLVGYCEIEGCDVLAETFRFKGLYLCRNHLMIVEGTTLTEDEEEELGAMVAKLGKVVAEMAGSLKEKHHEQRSRTRRGPSPRRRMPGLSSSDGCERDDEPA